MAKIISRKLMLIALLFMLLMSGANVTELFAELIGVSIITILFFLPLMIVTEACAYLFSPRVRAVVSLIIHVGSVIAGLFTLNFLGAVIQELASDEILPRTVEGVKSAVPFIVGFWALDELIRCLLREPSAVWKLNREIKQVDG